MGSSGLAATLRAAAALLRLDAEWDWFVTLHAADYPLVTQDGEIHSQPPCSSSYRNPFRVSGSVSSGSSTDHMPYLALLPGPELFLSSIVDGYFGHFT
jgi:hypothetical protein